MRGGQMHRSVQFCMGKGSESRPPAYTPVGRPEGQAPGWRFGIPAVQKALGLAVGPAEIEVGDGKVLPGGGQRALARGLEEALPDDRRLGEDCHRVLGLH